MRAVYQRVTKASVTIDGEEVSRIGPGAVILLGVRSGDTLAEAHWLARKVVDLRTFAGADGKMNKSLLDVGGALLVVSQFTLYGDCRKGRRPSYIRAAPPAVAEPLYEAFVEACRGQGVEVGVGRFGAMMRIEIQNDGPVTLILEKEANAGN